MTGPTLRAVSRPLESALATAEVVALGVRPGGETGPQTVVSGAQLPVDLAAHLARADASGRAGEVTEIPIVGHGRTRSLLLVGVGTASTADLRAGAAAAARRSQGQRSLAVDLGQRSPGDVAAVAEGAGLAAYAFTEKTSAPPQPVRRVDVHADAEQWQASSAEEAVARAAVVVRAVHRARDLTNTPANRKSPQWFARQARRAGDEAGLRVTVLDADALRRQGFGALLAVGGGSTRPPVLVRLDYRPRRGRASRATGERRVVLVGKGITFDSGGLSLKPADAMTTMKTDMAGAAAVLSVLAALPALDSPVPVTGVLALAENMPSGSAVRPGDVVTSYDGTTIEVLNTDAEGRLVLADALGWATTAADRPSAVVDLATLTGAASVGLGRGHAALYADDPRLGDALTAAAARTGERLWRMPLVEDYRATLESPVADLSHISRDPKVSGGSITAALFLQAFTHGVPWAHLDIAGPARAEADCDETSKGGTGFGVRLLLDWLTRSGQE
jgi:leucyl aminopeptidase